MFNPFANPSYQGSALERLINASPALTIQFSRENVDKFAEAIFKEYPQPLDYFLQATNQTNTLEGKTKEAANAAFPIGIGTQALMLIMSASGMAQFYGSQIDQLKMTNAGAAFALASALAEYAHACNVPVADTQGGYRRYLSGYLTLRDAMESFGWLGPWEQRMAAVEADQKKANPDFSAPKLDAKATSLFRTFVPKSEQAVLSHVAQHLNNVKNTVQLLNLMPGILDTAYLQMALTMPQLFVSGQWSGYSVALYSNGSCTFCGGGAPCRPCESRLVEIALMAQAGSYGGLGGSQPGPAATRAAQILTDAGIDPYRSR